eukprot:2284617-Pleurochrysis_carterae.AAC.1
MSTGRRMRGGRADASLRVATSCGSGVEPSGRGAAKRSEQGLQRIVQREQRGVEGVVHSIIHGESCVRHKRNGARQCVRCSADGVDGRTDIQCGWERRVQGQ